MRMEGMVGGRKGLDGVELRGLWEDLGVVKEFELVIGNGLFEGWG